jgi:flagellar biosynthesis/type III secretory pathway M-ring protein FliF/YscJ
MSPSDESPENRISQLEQSRSFWKWLALGQLLLLVVVIVAGLATSTMMAVRARQAEMIAREEARRAQEAEVQARHQAEDAAQALKAENRARHKDRK